MWRCSSSCVFRIHALNRVAPMPKKRRKPEMIRNRIKPRPARLLLLVVMTGVIAVGCAEEHETERGRGDSGVKHVNQGSMDLAIEMGDGFLNVGHKCVGPTGYLTSTKGDGNAGALTSPVFMDPFCLGVYDVDGAVNQQQLALYVQYKAALESGNGELASNLASQLIANAPSERSTPDPMLR